MLVHKETCLIAVIALKHKTNRNFRRKCTSKFVLFLAKTPQKWHVYSAFENAASRANPNVRLALRF